VQPGGQHFPARELRLLRLTVRVDYVEFTEAPHDVSGGLPIVRRRYLSLTKRACLPERLEYPVCAVVDDDNSAVSDRVEQQSVFGVESDVNHFTRGNPASIVAG
jgi:hypothetical protein